MLREESVSEMEKQKDGRFWPESLSDMRSPTTAQIHLRCNLLLLNYRLSLNSEKETRKKSNLPKLKERDKGKNREQKNEKEFKERFRKMNS